MKVESLSSLSSRWLQWVAPARSVDCFIETACSVSLDLCRKIGDVCNRIIARLPNGELSVWEKSHDSPVLGQMEELERRVRSVLANVKSAIEKGKIPPIVFKLLMFQLQRYVIEVGYAGSRWDRQLQQMSGKLKTLLKAPPFFSNTCEELRERTREYFKQNPEQALDSFRKEVFFLIVRYSLKESCSDAFSRLLNYYEGLVPPITYQEVVNESETLKQKYIAWNMTPGCLQAHSVDWQYACRKAYEKLKHVFKVPSDCDSRHPSSKHIFPDMLHTLHRSAGYVRKNPLKMLYLAAVGAALWDHHTVVPTSTNELSRSLLPIASRATLLYGVSECAQKSRLQERSLSVVTFFSLVSSASALGPVGLEFLVSNSTSDLNVIPTVSHLLNGGFVITYEGKDQGGNSTGVFFKLFSDTTTTLPILANTYEAGEQGGPDVATLPNGDIVILWRSFEQNGGSNHDVFGKRFSSDGDEIQSPTSGQNGAVGTEFRVNNYTPNTQSLTGASYALAPLKDGGFITTWGSWAQDGDRWGVFGKRFSLNGTEQAVALSGTNGALGNEFRANVFITDWQVYSCVAQLLDGGFVFSWSSVGQDQIGTYGILGKRYASNGTELAMPGSGQGGALGNEFIVNTYRPDNQVGSCITHLMDGGFVLAWHSTGQDGDQGGLFGKRYASNSSEVTLPTSGTRGAVGAEFPINYYTQGDQWRCAITSLTDGGFLVVWHSNGQDGSNHGIFGMRYASNGAEIALPTSGTRGAVGAEFPINSYVINDQTNPRIAGLLDGGFVATWQSNSQDGIGWSVYGKRFRADGREADLNPATSTGSTFTMPPHRKQSDKTALITSLVLGCLATGALGIAGTAYAFRRRLFKQLPNLHAEKTEMAMLGSGETLPTRSSLSDDREEKGHTIIGRTFALVNKITVDEAHELRQQTGIEIIFPPGQNKVRFTVGQGNFGKLRIARHVQSGQFVGVKKIKGSNQIAHSKKEAEIQTRLSGKPHIMPLLASTETQGSNREPVLYQFMPLAGFGNGDEFAEKLRLIGGAKEKERFFVHVATGLVSGLHEMHLLRTYHLDLKPPNFVIDQHGTVFIIDFGCAIQLLEETTLPNVMDGDVRYFSPERIEQLRTVRVRQGLLSTYSNITPHTGDISQFDAEKADSWSAGLCLLELAVGHYPFDDVSIDIRLREWNNSYFQAKIEQALNGCGLSRMWVDVLKSLLIIDPVNRVSIKEIVKDPAFQTLSFQTVQESTAAFFSLKQMRAVTPAPRSVDVKESDRGYDKTQDRNYAGFYHQKQERLHQQPYMNR